MVKTSLFIAVIPLFDLLFSDFMAYILLGEYCCNSSMQVVALIKFGGVEK